MKNSFFIVIAALALFIVACDKVNNPVIQKKSAVGSKFVTKTNAGSNNYRKIFLEDYTGQRCPNCPEASGIIKTTLLPRYRDTLVVLAIHAGDLSTPFGTAFKNQDFRTEQGTTWHNSYGISTWPKGLINRKDYNGNGLLLERSTWASVVPIAKKDNYIVRLNVTTNYDTTERALNTDIAAYFQKAHPNPTKIVVSFYEDKIVGKQDSSGIEVEEYEFEHMLRGNINEIWGSDLKTTPAANKDSVKLSFPNFALPVEINSPKGKPVNDKNVWVIAFIYDAVSKEVLQAEKIKIR